MKRYKGKGEILSIGLLIIVCFSLISCKTKIINPVTDTLTSGTVHISVDESFRPVIDEQVKVFESSYPDAKIIVHYKPEADCLRDIIRDSLTRMVIVTRGLSWK